MTPRNIGKSFGKYGTTLKEQRPLILAKSPEYVKNLIKKLIDDFEDNKTNIPLIDLLHPSNSSRAVNIPRPQNPFMLFRRNFSKGLVIAKIKLTVGESSKEASTLWKKMSENEKGFWKNLSFLAKKIHENSYPSYKFSPIKNKESDISSIDLIDLNDKIENDQSTNKIQATNDNSKTDQISNETFKKCESSIIDNDIKIENVNINNNLLETNDFDLDCFNIDSEYDQYNHYNILDLYFNPIDQNNLSYEYNQYDQFIDPMLLE